MSDNRDHERLFPRATRRQILEVTGAAGITVLAGCGSSGDGGSNGDGSTTGDQIIDQEFHYLIEDLPTEVQLNPYNPNNQILIGNRGMVFSALGDWSPKEREWTGAIASDWSVDGKKLTISINENHQWHDGTELTAEDVVRKVRLEKYFEAPFWEWLDSVEATDKKTVTYSLSKTVHPDIALANLYDGFVIDTPKSQYQEHLEALQNASSEDARQSALGDLTSFAPGYTDAIGTGLWKVDSVDTNGVTFTAWEGHTSYEDINFRNAARPYVTNEKKITALINDKIDAVNADTVGPNTRPQIESSGAEMRFIPGTEGLSWTLDLNHELFGRWKVRQALAYVLDGNKVLANPLAGTGAEIACGLPVNLDSNKQNLQNWLPNISDQLTRYTRNEKNLNKAESLLEEEGFTKKGDAWMTPNGKRFSIQTFWPSAGTNPSRVQSMNRQLSSFGIKGDIQLIEPGTWGTRLGQCNYSITHGVWGGTTPYQAFQTGFIDYANPRPSCSNGELITSFEVPWPPGEPGGTQSVNWQERFNQLLTASGEEATQLIEELAWIFNQALPQIPIFEGRTLYAVRTDNWNWPGNDHPVWGYAAPPMIAVTKGLVTAKTD